jgi:hypothetical protein
MAHGPFKQLVDGSILSDNLADIAPTSEAALWPVADYTGIAPNVLRSGQVYHVTAWGVMDTPGASQGNITLTPRWGTSTGGIALGASAATALVASATNAPWRLEYTFMCRKVGLSGNNTKVVGNGYFKAAVALIAASTGNVVPFGSTAEVSIDSHSAGGIFMGVTVGNASDLITVMGVLMETWN